MKLDRERFMAHFGDVFESSPWLAESVFERHGGEVESTASLAQRFEAALRRASTQEQLNLLKAHPELACGRREDLTEHSRKEQATAGLDACSESEFQEFGSLNREYRQRFGFPFIIAVAGLDRGEILDAFRNRIGNDPDFEFETALDEVCKIAALRIARAIKD